jgi:hypothetical protein
MYSYVLPAIAREYFVPDLLMVLYSYLAVVTHYHIHWYLFV